MSAVKQKSVTMGGGGGKARTLTPVPSEFRIKYSYIFSFIVAVMTVLTSIDRYLWNPLSLGIDTPELTGNWSVVLFDAAARISGRMIIVAFNVSLFTMCHTTANFMSEHAPRWLDVEDIREVHKRIHRFVGIYVMGIPTFFHIWTIFIPYFAGLDLGIFTKRPQGLSFYDAASHSVNIQGDDMYRLVIESVMWAVAVPYSVSLAARSKSWTMATIIHLCFALLYTVDNLRKVSHPHSHVFNTPFFLYWIFDRAAGIWWYRTSKQVTVKKVKLDEDYMVVYMRDEKPRAKYSRTLPGIGDVYFLNFEHATEMAHPFTTMSNWWGDATLPVFARGSIDVGHQLNKFPLARRESTDAFRFTRTDTATHIEMIDNISAQLREQEKGQCSGSSSEASLSDNSRDSDNSGSGSGSGSGVRKPLSGRKLDDDPAWDYAAIVRVYNDPIPESRVHRRTPWTQALARQDPKAYQLTAHGPYRSEYTNLADCDTQPMPPLILIGTGAGGAYLIDFFMFITKRHIRLANPVHLCYSSRSVALFQFITNMVCQEPIDNLSIRAYITDREEDYTYDGQHEERDMDIGRASFEEIINKASKDTEVYFCGSPGLQSLVGKYCRKAGLKLRQGHAFKTV